MAALTTIAAGASLAATATSAGLSFGQAAKQRKLQRAAEADADRAMAAARGKLDVNFAEQMSIKKEAYDLEREAMLVQGAQLTQAGIESERGSAATAGRVFAQQQLGQQQIRGAMADEMTNIEAAVLEEESRLRDLGVGLDLEEIAGQQMRAADAQRAATASTQQGIQSAVSAVQQGIEFGVPLYGKARAKRLARKAEEKRVAAVMSPENRAKIAASPQVQRLKNVELMSADPAKQGFQEQQRLLQERINTEAMNPFDFNTSSILSPDALAMLQIDPNAMTPSAYKLTGLKENPLYEY